MVPPFYFNAYMGGVYYINKLSCKFVVGLSFFSSALVVVIIDFILAIGLLVVNILYTRFAIKIKIHLQKWDWKLAKEAGVFTVAILAQSIINQFTSNVDNIVLGIYTTASTVTLYIIVRIYTLVRKYIKEHGQIR